MGRCIDDHSSDSAHEPLWFAQNRGYNKDELNILSAKLRDSLKWIGDDFNDSDLAMVRVGIPYRGPEDAHEAENIYSSFGLDISDIMPGMGVDVIKITKNCNGKPKQWAYKSKYTHQLFKKYNVPGLNNTSGKSYVDEWWNHASNFPWPTDSHPDGDPNDIRDITDSILSAKGGLPVKYSGDSTYKVGIPEEEFPKVILEAMTMIAQNPLLANGAIIEGKYAGYLDNGAQYLGNPSSPGYDVSNYSYDSEQEALDADDSVVYAAIGDTTPKGDIKIMRLSTLKGNLQNIKNKVDAKRSGNTLPTQYEADIRAILEETRFESAFTDIQYGGTIDLALHIRLPSSRDNQEMLESFVHEDPVAHPGKTRKQLFNEYFTYTEVGELSKANEGQIEGDPDVARHFNEVMNTSMDLEDTDGNGHTDILDHIT